MLKKIYLRFRLKLLSAFGRYLISDMIALQSLSAIGAGFLPWSGASLTPTAAAKIANGILVNRRRNMLELGSGVSTLLYGKLLHDLGGHLVSVDHDVEWLSRVKELATARGFADSITFVHAPLEEHPKAINGQRWYNETQIRNAIKNKVDLLLVDGPIGGHKHPMSRYPALPALHDTLTPDATVYLDDINRPEEKEIVARWSKEFRIPFDSDEGTLGLITGNLAIGTLHNESYTP